MAVTIDQLSVEVFNNWARLAESSKDIGRKIPLERATDVAYQVRIEREVSELGALEMVWGSSTSAVRRPWADMPAMPYEGRRSSPFTRFGVAPSLGSSEALQEHIEEVRQGKWQSREEKLSAEIIEEGLATVVTLSDTQTHIANERERYQKA